MAFELNTTPETTGITDESYVFGAKDGAAAPAPKPIKASALLEYIQTSGREKLTADRTYYVRTDGSDSNDGLANTAGGAFASITKAWKTICTTLDLAGYNVTVQLSVGTYAGGFSSYGDVTGEDSSYARGYAPVGGGSITVQGGIADRTSYVVQSNPISNYSAFELVHSTDTLVTVRGVTVTGSSPIYVASSCRFYFQYSKFSATSGVLVYAFTPGVYVGMYDIEYAGGGISAIYAIRGATVLAGALSFTGAPAYSTATIVSADASTVQLSSNSSGSATGPRYSVSKNSIITTTNDIPGSTAGTRTGGGRYNLLGSEREVLTADRTYYVRTDGSNSNTGLANTSAGAFLTLNGAWKYICQNLDINGYTVTVNVAAGTYAGGFSTYGDTNGVDSSYTRAYVPVGGGSIRFTGDTTTPSNVVIQCSANSNYAGFTINHVVTSEVSIRGFQIDHLSGGYNTILADSAVQLIIGNIYIVNTLSAAWCFVMAMTGIRANISNITLYSSCGRLFSIQRGAICIVQGGTITMSGTPAFSDAFAVAHSEAVLYFASLTFSGSATGRRYYVYKNAVIDTNGGGEAYLPGSTAGTRESGGRYNQYGSEREKLTADRTYYVRTDGADTNTGLANTAGGAFATITAAWKLICTTLDINGKTVTIQLGAGTYAGGFTTYGDVTGVDSSYANSYTPVGGGYITINGNTAAPASYIVESSANTDGAAFNVWHDVTTNIFIQGITLYGGNAVHLTKSAPVYVYSCNLAAMTGDYVFKATALKSYIEIYGALGIDGGAPGILYAAFGGEINLHDCSIALTGAPAWGVAFAECISLSKITFSPSSITGSATGKRYAVSYNGVITSTAEPPGSTAGTRTGGGRYNLIGSEREVLTADRTYYVRTDGADTNTGLTDSAGGAFLTWQAAYDYIASNLDFGGYTVTVQAGGTGSRTFSGSTLINVNKGWVGAGILAFYGNNTTPSEVVLSASSTCIAASGTLPGRLFICGFDVRAGVHGISSSARGQVFLCTTSFGGSFIFGACTYDHVVAASAGCYVEIDATYEANGNARYHLSATGGGAIAVYGTPTISGTRAFTRFANCTGLSSIDSGTTYTVPGTVTGTRYDVTLNGVINTFGSGATHFPGDVAGSTATGGQYA